MTVVSSCATQYTGEKGAWKKLLHRILLRNEGCQGLLEMNEYILHNIVQLFSTNTCSILQK